MAREDGRDLNDSLVRWPRDLKASHARQIEERRAIRERKEAAKRAERMAARAPLFQARAEALDKPLGRLLIRPCANEEELIAEGKLLHHCVASYAKDHAKRKTAILFIRRSDTPDKPYFTLEFDEKNLIVKQNRGLRNCARTPEVLGGNSTGAAAQRERKTAALSRAAARARLFVLAVRLGRRCVIDLQLRA